MKTPGQKQTKTTHKSIQEPRSRQQCLGYNYYFCILLDMRPLDEFLFLEERKIPFSSQELSFFS